MSQRFPNQGFTPNTGMPNRFVRSSVPNRGMQRPVFARGGHDPMFNRGMYDSGFNRGVRDQVPNQGLQSSTSNRGFQGSFDESRMQDHMSARGFQGSTSHSDMQGSMSSKEVQGSTSYGCMQSPQSNRGYQMLESNSSMQFPMSDRGMQGHLNERSMCEPMSKRDFEDPMPKPCMQSSYSNQNYHGFISESGMQGPLSNQGNQHPLSDNRGMQELMPLDEGLQAHLSERGVHGSERGVYGSMSERGMQGPMSDRGMHGPMSDRGMKGPMSDRGMQGHMSDRGMHGPMSERGVLGSMSDRGMQGSFSDRGMQGHVSDRSRHNPMSDRGMQGPVSDRGMQGHMSDRGMQGPMSDRGMHGPMSDKGMQGSMSDRGMQGLLSDKSRHNRMSERVMQGPVSDRGMQGPISDRGMHVPFSDRGKQGPFSDRGMQSSVSDKSRHDPLSDRGMQGPVSDRGMQGPLSDRGMHVPFSDRGKQDPFSDRGMQSSVSDRSRHNPMSDRGMQGPVSDRGMEGPMSDRGMRVPFSDRGKQGPMSDRGMHDSVYERDVLGSVSGRDSQGPLSYRDVQGTLSDRRMEVYDSCINASIPDRSFQSSLPGRGSVQGSRPGGVMQGLISDSMEGPMSSRGFQDSMSDSGFQGPTSDRVMQGRGSGFQDHMSNRGVKVFMYESGVQDSLSGKDVYHPAVGCDIQGPEANRGGIRVSVSNKGYHEPANRNPRIYEQNINFGPAASEFQGKGQFPVHQSVHSAGHFPGNPQVIAMHTQPGSVPQPSVSQGPVFQHVVIPVPVPVGSEIPPHLISPHITSTDQGNLAGPQSQNQIPGTQSQVNFSGMQSHGLFQGNSQSQTNRNDLNYYIGAKSERVDTGRSGGNTSYKYDNEQEKWPHNTKESYAKIRNIENERSHHVQHRTEEAHEYERKQRERSRSHDSSNFSYASEHTDISRRESYRHVSPFSDSLREKHTVYKRQEEFKRVQLQTSQENFGTFDSNRGHDSYERNEESTKSETSDTKFHHDRNIAAQKDNSSVDKYDKFERNYGLSIGSEELNRSSQFEKDQRHIHTEKVRGYQNVGEYQENVHQIESNYRAHTSYRLYDENASSYLDLEMKGKHDKQIESDFGDIDHPSQKNVRNDQSRGGERDTRTILITDGKREDKESIRYETEDRSDKREHEMIQEENLRNGKTHGGDRGARAILITDGKREDIESIRYEREHEMTREENVRNDKTLEGERGAGAILITDGKREDVESIRYEIEDKRDKREHEMIQEENVRNNKTLGGERGTRAILITDGKRDDIESIRYERVDRRDKRENEMIQEESVNGQGRGKRKLSPASSDRSNKKERRNNSPISDGKSHGDLKIHVSDKGRWIETDSNLSPVSNGAFENDRNIDQDHRTTDLDKGDDINSLDGAEMISDSESFIGDDNKDVITDTNDLSPISQVSLGKDLSEGKEEIAEYEHEEEKEGQCRSQHSSQSEEKLKHDGRNSLSPEIQTRERKDSSLSELSEQKNQVTEKNVKEFQLRVPDLCPAHNQKGCGWYGCAKLHVCKFFVLGFCKFGEYCTKGHNFFRGQPSDILSKVNPGFRNSNVTAEQIKLLLKNRISCINVAADLQRRLSTYKTENYGSVAVNEEQNVDVDPSFDARNYAPGSSFDFKSGVKGEKKKSIKKKNDDTKEKDKTKKVDAKERKLEDSAKSSQISKHKQSKLKSIGIDKNKSKNKSRDKKKGKMINDKGKAKDKNNKLKTEDASMLSPISGDEDDWDKYEKYENISEEEMSEQNEKSDDLDIVSSDESVVEQVQVNRSVDSFPLPTPENIAVPIGMNDPLVFNRPLKNNPQSYIGPLNRPPPAFPLTTDSNTPLFPVNQTLQPSNIGIGVPGLAMGVPGPIQGTVPNHLPSPEFMKHVVENLPKFKIESSEQKNVFKNDNNPSVIERGSHKKKTKTDKVERDPQLKETIKKLWKFPHKGVFNMSIIEFVTETEAYKEEFIAEIVRILVTLELPYVTMKKLLAVIKERVSINVKSETDMRKILEMYPNNFKIIETVESDDESDDSGSRKNVKIKANIGLGFCEKHGFLPFAIGKCECNSLHLCKFFFLSDCPSKLCKFGHKLKTDHNIAVLKQLKLHRLTGEEIMNFLADIENRNKETIPSICKYYIREKGCYKGDNTDFETICHSLHLCSYILKGKCMNRECDRSHSIRDKQPFSLLQKYGLDPSELGDETVLQMLGEKALESEKDKIRKVATKQQSGQTKARIENMSGSSLTDSQGKTSSPGEGLTLLTHTETRISSKYFVQNFKVPAVCKFYQNEMGCRKKDWGSEGKCLFLHICQHYVNGDCKFGNKCKRSHDLFSGQAAEILEKYNFDLRKMTADDILKRLNNMSGVPVEIPKAGNTGFDKGKVEITVECKGLSNEMDSSKLEKSKSAKEGEIKVNIDGKDEKTKDTNIKGKERSVKQPASSYHSGDIEDVIKHIMEHNKVVKK